MNINSFFPLQLLRLLSTKKKTKKKTHKTHSKVVSLRHINMNESEKWLVSGFPFWCWARWSSVQSTATNTQGNSTPHRQGGTSNTEEDNHTDTLRKGNLITLGHNIIWKTKQNKQKKNKIKTIQTDIFKCKCYFVSAVNQSEKASPGKSPFLPVEQKEKVATARWVWMLVLSRTY